MLLQPPNLRGHNDNYACSVSWGPQPQLPKKHTIYLTLDEHVHCYNCTSWCVKDRTDAYHPQCTERWKLGFLGDLFSSKSNISVFQFTPDPTHTPMSSNGGAWCQLRHFFTKSTPVMTVDLLLWLNSVDVQQMLIGHRRRLWSFPKTCQIIYTTCLLKVSVSFSTEYLLSKLCQLFSGEINRLFFTVYQL